MERGGSNRSTDTRSSLVWRTRSRGVKQGQWNHSAHGEHIQYTNRRFTSHTLFTSAMSAVAYKSELSTHTHCLCRFQDVVKIDWRFSCLILCTELRCQHLWPTVVSGKLKQSFSSVCGPTLWNNIIKQCSEIVGKLGRDPGTPEPQRKQTLLLFVFRFFKCDAVPPSHLAFWQELDGGLPG